MRREKLVHLASFLMIALLWAMTSCVDDINVGIERSLVPNGDADGIEPGEPIPQFCWGSEIPEGIEANRAMESIAPFDDGTFALIGDGPGKSETISRFTAEGTLMWKRDMEYNVHWIDSVPADGNIFVIESVPITDGQDAYLEYLTGINADGEETWSQFVTNVSEYWYIAPNEWDSQPSYTPPSIVADMTSNGSVVVVAAFYGSIVLGEGQPNEIALNSGGTDTLGTYAAHFSGAGELLSAKKLPTVMVPLDLALTSSDDILIVGTDDFGSEEFTLSKVSIDGQEFWSEPVIRIPPDAEFGSCRGGTLRIMPRDDGSFILAGDFVGEITVHGVTGKYKSLVLPYYFDSDGDPTAMTTYFLANFSQDGELLWARSGEFKDISNSTYASPNAFSLLPSGNLLIVGNVEGQVTLTAIGDNKTKLTGNVQFTATYNSSGQLIKVVPLGKASLEFDTSARLPDGGVIFAPRFDKYNGSFPLPLTDGSVLDLQNSSDESSTNHYFLKICAEDL